MATETLVGTLSAYRGTGANLSLLDSTDYVAGYYTSGSTQTNFGTVAKFDFSGIDISNVTSAKINVTRIKGGSDLKYTVALYRTVLTDDVSSTLRTGYAVCTTNRVGTSFTGGSDSNTEYTLSWEIKKSQLDDLAAHGWAIYYKNQARRIYIGSVTLTLETGTTQSTGKWSGKDAFYYDGKDWQPVTSAYYFDGTKWVKVDSFNIFG